MSQFSPFERPHFFTGKLLTADDFQQEQDYFRGKSRLHNRFLHGWGVVSGLGVSVDQGTAVVVSPGLALDCAGNELVLSQPERIPLSGVNGRHYVTIEYLEIPVTPVPSLQGESDFSRVRETVRVGLTCTNPAAGHRRMGPGTPGCGQGHALCLASIRQHGTDWRITPAKRKVLTPARYRASARS